MRITRDQWAMDMAVVTASRATCLRRSVGCVFLNSRGHVISTGYNGVASGLPHCNEPDKYSLERWDIKYPNACPGASASSGTNLDACQAIHAEQNALLQCKDVYDIETAYVTTSPCVTCTKLLLNTRCKRIIYLEEYPHTEARQLWQSANREWVKLMR